MQFTREFDRGFMFGLRVLAAMGHDARLSEVLKFLISVATGETTLIDSPEDVFRTMEARGMPLTDAEKVQYRTFLEHYRPTNQAEHKAAAQHLLSFWVAKRNTAG